MGSTKNEGGGGLGGLAATMASKLSSIQSGSEYEGTQINYQQKIEGLQSDINT
jgi:hypothetical protein